MFPSTSSRAPPGEAPSGGDDENKEDLEGFLIEHGGIGVVKCASDAIVGDPDSGARPTEDKVNSREVGGYDVAECDAQEYAHAPRLIIRHIDNKRIVRD